MPSTVGASHRRDQVVGRVRRGAASVILIKSATPSLLHEGAIGAASSYLRGFPLRSGGVRHVDLEVRERQGESVCSNIRAVREARVLLFGFGPEPQPSQHRVELVAQVPVSAIPTIKTIKTII